MEDERKGRNQKRIKGDEQGKMTSIIWGHLEGIWEASTLGFTPQPKTTERQRQRQRKRHIDRPTEADVNKNKNGEAS